MAKGNNRIKKVRDVKGTPEPDPMVKATEGNTGTLTVVLLNQILTELKELNGRLK